MPRQRINDGRSTEGFPEDFPQRPVRFQEASGLSWSEIARRIETHRATVWRWTEGVVRPNGRHMLALLALLALAEDLGIRHLFTEEGTARRCECNSRRPRDARRAACMTGKEEDAAGARRPRLRGNRCPRRCPFLKSVTRLPPKMGLFSIECSQGGASLP